ncbi:MAG: hypothetical protein ACRDTD_09335, partial [Pseudonocardiaceae bacterium]
MTTLTTKSAVSRQGEGKPSRIKPGQANSRSNDIPDPRCYSRSLAADGAVVRPENPGQQEIATFSILGPIEFRNPHRSVEIRGTIQRTLLA